MSVPIDPTVTSIVTQGLKRGGRVNPTATQIQEAIDHNLQEIKADIMLKAPTHKNLLITATTVTTRGQQRYGVPEDWNIQESITLLDGPDTYRGTAQGGSSLSITLDASFSASDDDLAGKYVIITSGTGIEEYRQVLTYDNSTKVATIDLPWVLSPVAGSTYLIVTVYRDLYDYDTTTEFNRIADQTSLGMPRQATVSGQEFLLYPVPDKSTYGLINRYYSDLSKLDENESLFIQLLREWRSLWIQGIAVKTMQRFDEDRYASELSIYSSMLDLLATQTSTVTQVRFRDL